jgi:hypothetical protein
MECLEKFSTAEEVSNRVILYHLFFFLLAADFLQTLLNTACANGDLQLPIPLRHDQDFPILQYADDTLIFMQVDISQLLFLKNLLQQFGGINWTQSKLWQILYGTYQYLR